MLLRSKFNQELFTLYKSELTLRVRNQGNLSLYYQTLEQFEEILEGNPPSSLLARNFLTRWSSQKPSTLSKYTIIVKGLLTWYGEDFDLKIKIPHELPEYVEE